MTHPDEAILRLAVLPQAYDKNLISVGIAVSEDNVPFMHETYEGNTHDLKIFPRLLDTLTEQLSNLKVTTENLVHMRRKNVMRGSE